MNEARNYIGILAAVVAGVAAYRFLTPPPFIIFIVAVVALFLWFLSRRGILLLFLSAGALSAYMSLPDYITARPHFLYGERGVVTDITHRGRTEILNIKLSDRNADARVLSNDLGFSRGDAIKMNCRLLPDDPLLRPAVKGQNDGPGMPRRSGVPLYSGYAEPGDIEMIGRDPSAGSFFKDCRDRIETQIEKSGLNRDTQDFLITLLLGDKSFLHPDLREDMANVGLSHVLAVSGLHTGIIAVLLLTVFSPLSLVGKRKPKYILALLLLWIFVLLTGLSPGTLRAAIMATCLFIGRISQRKGFALSSLCVASALIIIVSPSSLFDPGFQLSFVCVASLCIFCESLNPFDPVFHSRQRKIAAYFLPTLVATGATWLIVAYYFGSVPTMFLPANLLVLPFMAPYMLCAILYLLLSFCNIEIHFMGYLLEKGLESVVSFSRFLSGNGSTVLNVEPEAYTVFLWLAGVVLAGWGLHSIRRRRLKICGSALFFSLSLATLL